jgi:hypothetical protein
MKVFRETTSSVVKLLGKKSQHVRIELFYDESAVIDDREFSAAN